VSNYARDFSDVTITNGNSTLQINNNDSNFAIAPGSRLFLNGFLPVTVTEGDTINRTVTLAAPWPHADQVNVPAALIPIGLGDWLLQALENNRAAYNAFVEAIEGQEDPLTEVSWSDILANTIPEFAKRWSTFEELGDKPEHVLGYPSFDKVTGTVAREQLPDSIETDSKRTQALSPPVKPTKSLSYRLKEYPKMLPTEEIPTGSPNNRREILFDPVRQSVYFSFADKYKQMPTTLESRKFAVFYRGLIIRLNSAFTGTVTMKVFPMGSGGLGLPNNPTLTNNQWHTITESVTDLYKLGEFDSEYFEGIIDFVQLGNGWETLHTDKSYYRSLNGYFDVAFGTLRSPFDNFYLRDDGYWYSEDMLPETPHSMGASWSQDANDSRTYTVANASGSTDALRLFGDSYDEFEFEMIIVSDISRTTAITISNSAPNLIYYPGVARFITNERIFIKRQNSGAGITGSLTIESLRLRLPHNG